jgi:hypothetical protein
VSASEHEEDIKEREDDEEDESIKDKEDSNEEEDTDEEDDTDEEEDTNEAEDTEEKDIHEIGSKEVDVNVALVQTRPPASGRPRRSAATGKIYNEKRMWRGIKNSMSTGSVII